jgi:hypothetical protein
MIAGPEESLRHRALADPAGNATWTDPPRCLAENSCAGLCNLPAGRQVRMQRSTSCPDFRLIFKMQIRATLVYLKILIENKCELRAGAEGWTGGDLNPWPPQCECGALPTELPARGKGRIIHNLR